MYNYNKQDMYMYIYIYIYTYTYIIDCSSAPEHVADYKTEKLRDRATNYETTNYETRNRATNYETRNTKPPCFGIELRNRESLQAYYVFVTPQGGPAIRWFIPLHCTSGSGLTNPGHLLFRLLVL